MVETEVNISYKTPCKKSRNLLFESTTIPTINSIDGTPNPNTNTSIYCSKVVYSMTEISHKQRIN